MHKTIISDTSCLIVLTKINELELLHKVYGEMVTTNEVATEYGKKLPDWIKIVNPTEKFRQQILELQIDKGEASAISLALEIPDSTLILDDNKARLIAYKLGLEITGTVGVIVKAKLNGIIPSIKPLIQKISETDFRITEQILLQAFLLANEESI